MKKQFILIASSFLLATLVSGCGKTGGGGNGGGTVIDSTKTQLGVRFFDAGFGSRWLDDLKTRFEEKYKDVSFEPGKKGVQIIPHAAANGDLLNDLKSASGGDSVFFSESYYFDYYAGTGSEIPCADLTEVMSKPLNESLGVDANGNAIPAASDEATSVINKFRESEKAAYLVEKPGLEGKRLYGLPYIDCYRGTLSYDEDLFNVKGYFFDDQNTIGASLTDTLGLGPDGVANTADDGLPRTYKEFFILCDTMLEDGVVPFTWAGNWIGYLEDFLLSARGQVMGSEELSQTYLGTGELYDYIESADMNFTDLESINLTKKSYTSETYDRTYHTLAEYAPLEFMYRVVKNQTISGSKGKYYLSDATNFNGSYTHINAQECFLWGTNSTQKKNIGMLFDGTWWWNEAEDALKRLETQGKTSRYSKNIKYMALPKANEANFEKTRGENVVVSDYPTSICVKNNLTGLEKTLAELFAQFTCTNESLVEWNLSVNTPRCLSYTLTNEQYNKLSPYGKSIYNVHMKDEGKGYGTYEVVYNQSASDFYKANTSKFTSSNVFAGPESMKLNKFFAQALYDDKSNTLTGKSLFKAICDSHGNI